MNVMRAVVVAVVVGFCAACAGDHPPERIDTAKPIVRIPVAGQIYTAQDDAGRNGMRFVDAPDTATFKVTESGWKVMVNGDRVAVFEVATEGRTEVWLLQADSAVTPTPWTVVATLKVPDVLTDSVRMWFDYCLNRGLTEGLLLAVLNYDHVPTMTRVIHAWKVDALHRRFEAVPAEGVTCHNGQALQDSLYGEAVLRTKGAQAAALKKRVAEPEADAVRRDQAEDSVEKVSTPIPMLRAPSELKQLPASVRDTLTKRGCGVPYLSSGTDTNVFRGNFLGTGLDTWAVWCLTADSSTILVFRDGVARPVTEKAVYLARFPRHPVYDSKQYKSQRYGCVGHLYRAPTSATYLKESFAFVEPLSDQERKAPPHDGIEDQDCEGVSTIHYWTGRQWVMLPGAH